MKRSYMQQYIYEIHALRAFACLCVLLVHVSASFYLMQNEQFNWLTFALNQLGRFGTPIFSVISGFLLFYQVRRSGFHLKKFLHSRITKIVFPFLIWSSIYLLLNKFYFGISLKKGLDPFDYIIEYLLLGGAYYHLYFIAMVIQFYFLFPLLQLVKSKKAWLVLLFISFIISLSYLYSNILGINITNEYMRKIYYSKGFFIRWCDRQVE